MTPLIDDDALLHTWIGGEADDLDLSRLTATLHWGPNDAVEDIVGFVVWEAGP